MNSLIPRPDPIDCFSLLNSKLRPKEFPEFEFDIHVYYNSETERSLAMQLRDQMRNDFAEKTVFVGELIDIPVGPHLTPMWEANFPKDLLFEVVSWLMINRGSLVILVHRVTGDHYWDHTAGAMFMGGVPPLNLGIFQSS
jgi:aromatic ring-cleaving dioxygenase